MQSRMTERHETTTSVGSMPSSRKLRGLVELHGGRLDIASEKGGGTTVTVWLPQERVVLRDDTLTA